MKSESLRPIRVLLVDDDIEYSAGLKILLEKRGIETDIAPDAEKGWSFFVVNDYDLVITDIKLPGKNGLGFITDMKNRRSSVKILAITAGGYIPAEDYLRVSILFGANRALAKPFSFDQLLDEILTIVD
ncbi:MAG: response regulator [Bacteroidales bacterium]|nr:response regulator [Bacteroidales bacterium]